MTSIEKSSIGSGYFVHFGIWNWQAAILYQKAKKLYYFISWVNIPVPSFGNIQVPLFGNIQVPSFGNIQVPMFGQPIKCSNSKRGEQRLCLHNQITGTEKMSLQVLG